MRARFALSFAFASIAISFNKRRRLPNDGAFPSVVMTVGVSLVLFLVFEDGVLPSFDDPKLFEGVLWFCVAGLFAMVFGRTRWFSINRPTVTRGTTKKLNPFFSILLAVIILGETLIWEEMLGVFALALAIGFTDLRQEPQA